MTKQGGVWMEGANKKADFNKEGCQSKIILHCETVIFAGKSFIKREDFGK